MKQKTKPTVAIVIGAILLILASAHAQRYMENLGRGVVAIRTGSSQVYVGWRMLGTDPNDIAFNLYRNDTKVNSQPITNSTNYVDDNGSTSAIYHVRAVINGQEKESSEAVEVWDQQYLTVPLQVPSSYTPGDASAGDLDGDSKYEIVLKWEDTPRDNADPGYTNSPILDAYEMDGTLMWRIDLGINIREGAHYTQFMVYDLDSDGRAEVACKTAPGTVDGQGNYVLLPGDDPNADYRNEWGYILAGPEYLTIFDGLTGAELATTDYIPPRHPDTLFPTPQQIKNIWGDDYGNRVDRFLACIAYLDGIRPSLVMCRGYYYGQSGYPGRTVLAAWNWRGGQLTNVWTFDTMFGPPENDPYRGQGNHNLSVGDVDGDGKDEIIYGACAIDDDGTGLYTTGLGHGDAMHLGDLDPNRPGLEVFDIHEGDGHPVGAEFRDADTGELIWGASGGDVGRGVSADIDPRYWGDEVWAAGGIGLYTCKGEYLGSGPSSKNFAVWWDASLMREILDGNYIDKWNWTSATTTKLLTAYGCSSINGSKATPCLSADLFGDWREEVIWRIWDNTALRVYTTTIPTTHRIYTLMHDPQYRLSIAWQNVGYNQPPHTGFYLGDSMAAPPHPDIRVVYGDFTGDGIVDIDDLSEFVEFWQVTDCNNVRMDWNGDCIINSYEFSLLSQDWLEGI